MADRSADFLLVGGGIAAASCARALREHGADGSIVIAAREADAPYDRPPLSKTYLAGSSTRADAAFAGPDWYEQNGIELLTRTSVMRLDASERIARLSTKEEVGFDKLLLATGANVKRLRAEGSDLDGIHYLRAFGNADAIREEAASAERVVLIGGSYIGCEVAATLTSLGKRCTILMQESLPLERHFGADVGRFVEQLLSGHGIEFAGSDELDRFEGADGRVTAVVTKSGRRLNADLVVIGAGVAADTMLARSAGLQLGDLGGIACSKTLETSTPGIFAAGDVAEYASVLHKRTALVEHWDAALQQGRTAARNMLGARAPHDVVPYFWSDIGDWTTLEYVGVGTGEPVVRGSVDDGDFTVLWLDGERLVAALTVGRPVELAAARALIADGRSVSAAALGDEDSDLSGL